MDKELQGAPEITISAETAAKGEFMNTCPPAVNELYTKIWTDVLK